MNTSCWVLETATDIDAQLLKVTSSNDILVVVIANEPQSLYK